MLRYIFRIPFLLLLLTAVQSCKKTKDTGGGTGSGTPNPVLTVSSQSVSIPATVSSYSITVTSNVNWTVTGDQSWIVTSVVSGSNNGTFNISVGENPVPTPRSGNVTVSNGTITRTITISQAANPNFNGITLIGGTSQDVIYYDYYDRTGKLVRYSSHDGFSRGLELEYDTAGLVRTKLVNASRGTFSVTTTVSSFSVTNHNLYFSNIHNWTNLSLYNSPDTAGKLQLWIYRADGQDLVAAINGRPAVKRIIQIMGRWPNSIPGIGDLQLSNYDHPGYPVHLPPITNVSQVESIFSSSKWTFRLNQFTWSY